jgi:thiol-disulfide isomerase/thioredoxin
MAVNSQTIAKWKMNDVVKSYSGKNDTTYVVNFWATFCKPCNEELPDFIRLAEKYKKQKVKLLLVSLDLPSYVAVRLPAFIKKNNYKTNHVWLNETDADIFCPMIDPKWSGAIPATIIVNNKTGYRKFAEDQISPADFEKYLNEAISGSAMNKFMAPMNDAVAIYDNPEDTAHVKREFVTFKSSDSSVYAVAGGKVSTVVKIDHMKVVIIEKDKLFYTYSNLGSTLIKKGDEIKPNQLIGYAAFDLDKLKPTVELYISTGEEYMVLTKDDFIKRSDKKLTDHSIDAANPVRVQMKF